jgi:hypothetical protein
MNVEDFKISVINFKYEVIIGLMNRG